ncbi:putative neutral sphingomyelinase [Bactrocera neohumeralis]|uniref:putative neutral sphingomyelinase n=1 Tax=Bactrocera tryoni TaxID=59916 RepID=UPI001A98C941|nr:putative neutral sphingomyelinase [Bactrocera tryoni]XP_050332720.1 putative neutral sphingomyelinase [Bactrocera neohumeralis]
MLLNLSILTLNVWGIPFPFISKDREVRIAAIGLELSSGKYDIVSLQEVWSRKDCETLKNATQSVLPYAHYFYSGVIGSGLLVLSKYPILSSFFHPWSVNGYFHRIQHADWFGGKGVGLCRILVDKHVVHLYNTHLHAEYNNNNDDYKTHRVIQAFDTAQFIRATRGDSVLQVLAGDLNAQPHDLTYKVLLYTSKMKDCCNSKNIVTNEYQKNSYTASNAINNMSPGVHIDHIFARSPENIALSIIDYGLPLTEPVPGQNFSYSDHEAVLAKLHLRDAEHCIGEGACIVSSRNKEHHISEEAAFKTDGCLISKRVAVLHESISLCETSLDQLNIDRIFYYSVAVILAFILVVFLEYPSPLGFRTLCIILKLFISGGLLFCIFMGSVWNYMEWNGVLSGKVAMELMLRSIEVFESIPKN